MTALTLEVLYPSLGPSPEPQMFNYLPDIFTWISNRHLKLNLDSTSLQPLKTSSIFNPALQSSPRRKRQLRSPIAKTKSSGFPLPHTHPTCNPSSKPQANLVSQVLANQNLPLPKTPTATVMINSHILQDPLCNSLLSPRLYLPSQTKAPHTQVIQKSQTLSQLSQTLLSFPSKKVSHAGNRGLSDL